jgi:release factor glutamine methyltransferase
MEREGLLLAYMDSEAPLAFDDLIARRAAGEPVAYITGTRAFWTIELKVGPGSLIPRPDSETLIEAAVAHFGDQSPANVLDLGTGPGTLLLAALAHWPEAHGLGIDASEEALAYARDNANSLGLAGRARFQPGDWTEGLDESFDLILCNPPYVEKDADLPRDVAEWEPHQALFAESDGLGEIRRIAPELPRLLAPGGIACIEIGAGQAESASDLFEAEGFAVAAHRDLAGHTRCLALTRCDSGH